MGWGTSPRTWVDGDIMTEALLNAELKDKLDALELHAHGGASGAGASALAGVDTVTFDDQGDDPSAPGTDKVVLYSKAGVLKYRAGSGGAATALGDLVHATRHDSGGADPLAKDSTAGTAMLRSLGLTSVTAAVGSHDHLDIQEFPSSGTWTKPASATRVLVVIGSGGGGGSTGANASDNGAGGEGGAGGEFASFFLDAAKFAATEAVTVGAGGVAGQPGVASSVNTIAGNISVAGGRTGNPAPGRLFGGTGGDGIVEVGGAGDSVYAGGGGGGAGGGRVSTVGKAAGAGGTSILGGAGASGGAGANSGSNGTIGSAGTDATISKPVGGGGGGGGAGDVGAVGGPGGKGYVRVLTLININKPSVP